MEDWIEQTKLQYPTMFADIHPYNFGCGVGWKRVILDLCAKLYALEPTVTVIQIKEKFGTLRFYIGPCPNETVELAYNLIEEAERQSAVTCERCGTSGIRRNGGWIRTLCDDCELEYRKERP